MVLRADDEPLALRPGELAGDLRERAVERGVVAVSFARQRDVQRVVEAVEPHRVVPPLEQGPEVLASHLADHERSRRNLVHALGELGEDVPRRVVLHRVHRVEPQPVEVVLLQPQLRVVDASARTTARPRSRSSGRAPRRLVRLREVRSELAEVVAIRPEMVVDDVEDHAEPDLVARADQTLELLRLP